MILNYLFVIVWIHKISFGTQGTFPYKVPVFKYLEKSPDELDNRKLIVLIPFQLLRLRQAIEKERTHENMEALKNLICHDILDSLNRNVDAGNITPTEAMKLSRMVLHLYHHIYDKYDELEKEGVNQMAEEALIFDVDILDNKIHKLEKELENLETVNQSLQSDNQSLIMEKQVWKLLARGVTKEEISRQTGLPLEKIQQILSAE